MIIGSRVLVSETQDSREILSRAQQNARLAPQYCRPQSDAALDTARDVAAAAVQFNAPHSMALLR